VADDMEAYMKESTGESRQTLPEGMTADKLRTIAGWLDTYDKLAERFVALTRSAIQQEAAATMLVTVRGSEVQDDLRHWAEAIDASATGGGQS
jgi:hypothetical protein